MVSDTTRHAVALLRRETREPQLVLRLLEPCLRGLCRVGLAEDAPAIVDAALPVAKDGDVIVRAAVAGGLFVIGETRKAEAFIQDGFDRLKDHRLGQVDRLRLNRIMARSLAFAPVDITLSGYDPDGDYGGDDLTVNLRINRYYYINIKDCSGNFRLRDNYWNDLTGNLQTTSDEG